MIQNNNSSPRITGVLLVTLVLALAISCTAPPQQSESGAPPIVLITIDGLIADELGTFGGPLDTPALTALAQAGRAWPDGWTAAPMTRPAVTTYLTGLAPDRHGVRDDLFTALPAEIPTLADLLSERGYRTGAFPGTSVLGYDSGLLGGFEIVDEPPRIPINPARWLPGLVTAESTANHFEVWLEGLPAGAPWFAWMHFGEPALTRLSTGIEALGAVEQEERRPGRGKADDAEADEDPPDMSAVDGALASVLAAIETRGDLSRSLIVVVGTLGDPFGREPYLVGPGYSLGAHAVTVPVVARFPDGLIPAREPDQLVWAPDLPATIASLAGVELDGRAEGRDLLEAGDPDRVLFSWSWAPLDQLGWPAPRAARQGRVVLYENAQGATLTTIGEAGETDPATEERLAKALAGRVEPARTDTVPLEDVEDLLQGLGLELEPIPAAGSRPTEIDDLRKVTATLWRSRLRMHQGKANGSLFAAQRVLSLDPENLGAMVDRGQLFALSARVEEARELLEQAVTRVPTRSDALHWYAHSLWPDALNEAGRLLQRIEPYLNDQGDVLYDLACYYSLEDNLDDSEIYLRRAIEAGYRDWSNIETDSDLRNLRESGRFSDVMREFGR